MVRWSESIESIESMVPVYSLKIPKMDENGRYSPPYMDGIGMYKDIYIGVHHLDVMNF